MLSSVLSNLNLIGTSSWLLIGENVKTFDLPNLIFDCIKRDNIYKSLKTWRLYFQYIRSYQINLLNIRSWQLIYYFTRYLTLIFDKLFFFVCFNVFKGWIYYTIFCSKLYFIWRLRLILTNYFIFLLFQGI